MPKISVLLTSYNYEAFLAESVQSVLSQTFTDFELIVVDDCSTDSSLEILRSFDDPRLKVISNKKNMGQEYAFGLINDLASGEYIAIADADCRWLPEKLEKQIKYIDSHPDCGAVFTKANLIDENGHTNTTDEAVAFDLFDQKNRTRQEWLRRFFYEGNCLCNPSALIRREAYKECYSTANGMWTLQDMYKWVRLFFKYEIFILDDCLTDVRMHGKNMSGPFSAKNHMRLSNEMYQIYNCFYNISPADFVVAFPDEAKKYTINGRINTKFALSRILLAFDLPSAKSLALNKLFEMLNNPTESKEIAELYGYDNISYRDDEANNIPFLHNPFMGLIKFYTPKLYFDFGNGFNESDIISKSICPDLNGAFSVTFSGIKDFCGDKAIKGLRFDPDDSCVKAKIDRIVCDEKTIEFEANKPAARFFIEDGYDVFYTSDPSYTLHLPSEKIDTIKIEGTIFKINSLSLTELVNKLANENLTATGKFNELKTHTENLEKANSELTTALSELKERTESLEKAKSELTESLEKVKSELTANLNNTTAELNLVVNSISWKLTKPLRALKRVFRRLFLSR